MTPTPVAPWLRMKFSSGPHPQPRSSTRRPGPIPICSATILVLAPLRLLEAQREVAVVLGAAEVRELAQAEPEDAIDQRIGELEILAVSHSLNAAGSPFSVPGEHSPRVRGASPSSRTSKALQTRRSGHYQGRGTGRGMNYVSAFPKLLRAPVDLTNGRARTRSAESPGSRAAGALRPTPLSAARDR